MSAVTPSDLAAPGFGRDADRPFDMARMGCRSSRWEVLANCIDYLRFVVRQGRWSNPPGIAKTSDLVQYTIVEAWQKFSRFQGDDERQLRGWIKAILINSARRDRRDARPIDACAYLDDIPGRGPLPDRPSLDAERASRIEAALSQLKGRDQSIIRLRIWDELTFAEIGRRLDLSEDAARMLFSRALGRLRRRMRSNHGPG